ncbi:hypothetical protein BLOT_016024 [Blomia tropicalis]|nr:hypothetical protein BLOT_016024 [Blomia tropicalis]
MTKVIPIESDNNDNICPRYQKWLKRIKKIDLHDSRKNKETFGKTNRSKHTYDHKDHSGEPLVIKKTCSRINSEPNESSFHPRQIFNRIRQKGRNFGIRCKTTVELWRKWIKRGILWDRHANRDKVDIDIINKPENKLKDFTKKTIINEVIPEEEDENDETDTLKINENRKESSIVNSNGNVTISIEHNVHKTEEKNGLEEKKSIVHRAFSFKKENEESSDLRKMETETTQPEMKTMTTNKYPIETLASMNIDRIDSIGSGHQSTTSTTTTTDDSTRTSTTNMIKPRTGAIHRAYNKLKLFF